MWKSISLTLLSSVVFINRIIDCLNDFFVASVYCIIAIARFENDFGDEDDRTYKPPSIGK